MGTFHRSRQCCQASYAAGWAASFLRHVPDGARAAPLRARLLERLPSADYFLADPESAAYGVSPLEFDDRVVEEDVLQRHVDRLEEAQQPDGGWPIAWTPSTETAVHT